MVQYGFAREVARVTGGARELSRLYNYRKYIMASKIENYALLSDWHGSALVSRDGSIDWLCVPRFDSDASMASLLGRDEHGRWSIYPAVVVRGIERRYRTGTMILETDYQCD